MDRGEWSRRTRAGRQGESLSGVLLDIEPRRVAEAEGDRQVSIYSELGKGTTVNDH